MLCRERPAGEGSQALVVLDSLSLIEHNSEPGNFVQNAPIILIVLLPPLILLLSSRILSRDLSFGVAFLHLRVGRQDDIALHKLLKLLVASQL